MAPRAPADRNILALSLSALLLSGCADFDRVSGAGGAALHLTVSVAEPLPDAPEVGPVDTLRVDLRGPGGELLEHPPRIPLGSGDRSFSVPLFGRVGPDRQVVVLFFGARGILRPAGAGDAAGVEPARGILYMDRVTGIDLKSGVVPRVAARVHLFIPRTLAVERLEDGGHRIRWESLAGADRYRLTQIEPNGARRDTVLTDTTFVGRVEPMRYRIAAIEATTSLSGAPGDEVLVTPSRAPMHLTRRYSQEAGVATSFGLPPRPIDVDDPHPSD